MNNDPSICNGCGRREPEIRFRLRKVGDKKYRQHLCTGCSNTYQKRYRNVEVERRASRKMSAKKKILRAAGTCSEDFIYMDCKQSDKKKSLEFDLDRNFIRDLISSGCSYCGETKIRMGLDRIDNTLGHIKINVVAACMRCNYLRRDMPHDAWMMLVPAVRMAREIGAFGEWDGFGRRSKKNGELTESGIVPVC